MVHLYDENLRRVINIERVSSKTGEKYNHTHKWANQEALYTFWKNGKKAIIDVGMDKYKNCYLQWERITKDGQDVVIWYDKNGKEVDCSKK